MLEIIAQIIGFFGFAFALMSFQKKERNGILLFQLLANVSFTVHFFLLGAMTGAIFNLISAVRCALFSQRGRKKWADSLWLPAVFCLLSLAAVIVTWSGIVCVFPLLGMLLTTFSFYMTDAAKVRLFTLPNSIFWIIYNVVNHSVSGICTELFVMTSIVVGMLRFDKKKND